MAANASFFKLQPWNVESFLTKGPVTRIYFLFFSIMGTHSQQSAFNQGTEAWLCLCLLSTDWTHVMSSVNHPLARALYPNNLSVGIGEPTF